VASAIHLNDVSVTLGEVHALLHVGVSFERGTITGLLGPSGSGKTTLMRAIVGTQRVTSGSITALDAPAGSAAARPLIGYMSQAAALYPDLSVQENLEYFATILDCPRSRVTELIDQLELGPRAHAMVRDLSGGETNRTSLAVALLARPPVLILDEPTVGLDPLLRRSLWLLFHELADSGTALVVSSHVMDEALQCDRLVLLHQGQLLYDGPRDELASSVGAASIEDAYIALATKGRS